MISIKRKDFYEIDETAGNIRLAHFMTTHHALERSVVSDLGPITADILVGREQITYHLDAGGHYFVLIITGEPDEDFLIRLERVDESGQTLATHELETDMDAAVEAIFELAAAVSMTDA